MEERLNKQLQFPLFFGTFFAKSVIKYRILKESSSFIMEFVVIIIGKVMQVNSVIGSTVEKASENFLKIFIFLCKL